MVESGATHDEAEFLVRQREAYFNRTTLKYQWHGERVELNAMTSEQLLAYVEAQLQAHGIGKYIPDEEAVSQTYEYAVKINRLNIAIERVLGNIEDQPVPVPDDLSQQLRELLESRPELS